jgi:hypothetical protein
VPAFPQVLDTASFELYGQGDTFSWEDQGGVVRTKSVDLCDYNPRSKDISGRLGLTAVFIKINQADTILPFFSQHSQFNRLISNPDVCVDQSNPQDPRWTFHYGEPLRIPIFSSVCPRPGFHDYGNDSTEWVLTIPDCQTYEKVHDALEWWVDGSHGRGIPPDSIYTGSMIMAHESTHVRDFKRDIQGAINGAFESIFQSRRSRNTYPCLKQIIEDKYSIGKVISDGFFTSIAPKNMTEAQRLAHEIKTDRDKDTMERRKAIFAAFERWGTSRGWNDGCP